VKTGINKTGNYPVSNLVNYGNYSFAQSQRPGLAQNSKVPGPGNYRLPSEFGVYSNKPK